MSQVFTCGLSDLLLLAVGSLVVFVLPALFDHRRKDFNRMKILIIEQNCLWSDFQGENWERFCIKELVFYIRTVLTENNRFLCILSFTVFIVNKYFTTVTKIRIWAHHLLLMIILSILKCVTRYQVTIIPSYQYSEMREFKIFNTSHFVT